MGGSLSLQSIVHGGSTFTFTAHFERGGIDELGVGESTGPVHGMPADAGAPISPLHILLAEDGKVNQQVAMGLLTLDGHTVRVVEDGKQAVQAVRADAYDVVLMDLQMPEMDGLDATRVIRELEGPDGPHVPIVALTAIAMRGDRERCMRAGMDAYISKPIDRIELQETLRAVMRSRPAPEAGPVPRKAETASGEAPGAAEDLVDWAVAARRIPGGARGIRELATLMRSEGPRLLAQLRSAQDAGAAQEVRLAAHTLRGSAHHFGAAELVDIAQKIEDLAEKGDLPGVAPLVPELGRLVGRLEATLAGADEVDLTPWVSG
jgi:CheY-like chemotaxis protein/HPt (histidine-containing phosphotransfer) domain-containing protein